MGKATYLNGIKVTGGVNYNEGVFVDTDNIIVSRTDFKNSFSYTATKDCFIVLYLIPKQGEDMEIKINNKFVGGMYSSGIRGLPCNFMLKKGQTISASNLNTSYDSAYIVYGIQSETSAQAVPDYSTTEHKIGRKWIDGKDIYEITYNFETPITVTYNGWYETTIDSTNIDKVVSCIGVHSDGTNYGTIYADPTTSSHTKLSLETPRNAYTCNIKYLTLQYTKLL